MPTAERRSALCRARTLQPSPGRKTDSATPSPLRSAARNCWRWPSRFIDRRNRAGSAIASTLGNGQSRQRRMGMIRSDWPVLWAPRVLSVVRIMVALLFLEHGTQKLLDFPPGPNHPAMFTLSWVQGVIELVGGIMLALGLFTRPVAFILSG